MTAKKFSQTAKVLPPRRKELAHDARLATINKGLAGKGITKPKTLGKLSHFWSVNKV